MKRRGLAPALAALVLTFAPFLAFAVSVVDDTGRRVTLAEPARRIVSLAPHTTELVFAAGAGDKLAAVSDFSDFPEAAAKLPSIGGSQGIDVERVATIKPDLVVAWHSGNSAGQVEAIERLGIAVFRSEPKTLEDVATSLERLGTLADRPEESQKAARDFRRRAAELTRRYAGKAPVRVYYQVWNRPLMTIGGAHLISHLISLCGGRNVFERIDAPSAVIDAEAVIAARPEVMVVAAPEIGADRAIPENLSMWNAWPQIPAVREKHMVAIEPGLITRHTPRVLQGAEKLCRAIDGARQSRPQTGG
jgi:iron complex transport system substrate-binding protein